MERSRFEEIYINYGERRYPKETAESVKRCHVPYEQKQQAGEAAAVLRKVTKKNAIADVQDFFNCLKRSYCGYDYFFTDENCEKIQKTVTNKIKWWPRRITNRKLCHILFTELNKYIVDSHFELYTCGRSVFFRKKYYAYVTDIVLSKVNDGYEVVKETDGFSKGRRLSEKDVQGLLMPTIYVGDGSNINDAYFLLGKYSLETVTELTLCNKKIKAHRILSDSAEQSGEERLIKKDGYCIVNHASYGMPWNDEALLEEYYQDGLTCAKRDAVILNLAGNGGGCSCYPEKFYEGLCKSGENGFIGAHLPFPEDITGDVKKYEYYYPDENVYADYDGDLYVVMNKESASSAEMGISPAFYLKNAVCVGSASYGCGTFGNCALFQLPNSKIIFSYGHRLFYHEKFEEGKGFMPDYWIDDANPVLVVEQYINKKVQANKQSK